MSRHISAHGRNGNWCMWILSIFASSLLLWRPFRLLMTFADKLKSYLIKTAELLFQFCCAEILTYCLLTSFSWHWPLYQLLVGFYLSWPDFVCASAWGHRLRLFRGLMAVTAPWHTASCVCQCRNCVFTHMASSSTLPPNSFLARVLFSNCQTNHSLVLVKGGHIVQICSLSLENFGMLC